MSRTKKAFYGVVTSYLSYFILILIQVFLSPLILAKYGQETLGAYGSVNQLVGYLLILDSAINITFNRYFAQAFGKPNPEEELKLVFSASVIISFAIGLVSCFFSVITSFFVADLFHVSNELASDLKWAMIILGLMSLIKVPFVIFVACLYASQRMVVLNFISIFNALLRSILVFLFVFADLGITGIVLSGLISEVTSGLICFAYFHKSFKSIIVFNKPKRNFLMELFHFSKSSLIIQLTTKLRLSTDTLLVGVFVSLGSASIFHSSVTPPLMCFTLANLLMTNTLPGMNEIIGTGDTQKIRKIYFKLLRGVVALALFVLVGIVVFNRLVVTLWVGEGQFIGDEVNLMFALYISLLIVGSYNGNFLISMGVVSKLAKVGLIVAIAALALSVVFIKKIGVSGLMISSLIVMIPGNIYSHYLVTNIFGTNIFFKPVT